jgi:hypothetical protein
MIKRYDLDFCDNMIIKENGDFVLFVDHEQAMAEKDKEIADMLSKNAAINGLLDELLRNNKSLKSERNRYREALKSCKDISLLYEKIADTSLSGEILDIAKHALKIKKR